MRDFAHSLLAKVSVVITYSMPAPAANLIAFMISAVAKFAGEEGSSSNACALRVMIVMPFRSKVRRTSYGLSSKLTEAERPALANMLPPEWVSVMSAWVKPYSCARRRLFSSEV